MTIRTPDDELVGIEQDDRPAEPVIEPDEPVEDE